MSGKLKIRETQKLGTENPGTENPGTENPGSLKSRKLKIRKTQNPGSHYMVIRWFEGGRGGNGDSPPPHLNYHMLTLRLRRR